MQKYYEYLRAGAVFVQTIQKDLANEKNKLNRHQRRRMQKTLVKGEFTEELVNHYKNQIDSILAKIDAKLNPTKVVDGAKMYENLKKKEK